MRRVEEPDDGAERELLLGWLAFHRDALEANCDGVDADDLVRSGLAGSTMSLLGLVRHLTEMERVYLGYCLQGGELELVYGPYEEGEPAGDFDGLSPEMVEESFAAWRDERAAAVATIATVESMEEVAAPALRSLRWCLMKVIQEYARHNGHADLIRESVDGWTGE